MPELTILHCTLRIIRRGGWSWGPAPRALLDSVVRTLPALIARELERLFPGELDTEIATAVRIRVRCRLQELMAGTPRPVQGLARDDASQSCLATRLADAVEQSLAVPRNLIAEPPKGESSDRKTMSVLEPSAEDTMLCPAERLLRLLRGWHAEGELGAYLVALPAATLEAWDRVLHPVEVGATRCPPGDAEIEDAVREILGLATRPTTDRLGTLRRRLFLAVELADRFDQAPRAVLANVVTRSVPHESDAHDQQEVGEVSGTPVGGTPASKPIDGRAAHKPASAGPRSEQHPGASTAGPAGADLAGAKMVAGEVPRTSSALVLEGDVYVASALPFLLLGSLASAGYLLALDAALAAVGLDDRSGVFGAALAYKVLPTPERGWLRSAETSAAAAAFAGRSVAADEELTELARLVDPCLPPLDLLLGRTLRQGHTGGQPFVLVRVEGDELLLVDLEGLFPIAFGADVEALASLVRDGGAEPVLVPSATASPEILHALDDADLCFVTDAPPTRHEPWQRLRTGARGRWRGWSNVELSRSRELEESLSFLDHAQDRSQALQSALAARPAAPRVSTAAFERSLGLAASFALGTIAWTLWRSHETVDPLLALERFGDLEARVSFLPDVVRVRLPMGRRHQDLFQNGLLRDVREVPWLGGRVVTFVGG